MLLSVIVICCSTMSLLLLPSIIPRASVCDYRAVVLAFNLPGTNTINLTRDHIVGIYNGSITSWNDSSLQEWNPSFNMPSEAIKVMARSDKSGTTEIFTSALSEFSPQWAATLGTFSSGVGEDRKPINWDEGVISYFGYTNLGMSGLLLSIDYTIAYLSVAHAVETNIPYAMLVNSHNQFVSPSASNVQAAMDVQLNAFSSHFTLSLVNAPGASSYPISGFSYFIIHLQNNQVCSSAMELYRFMEWFLFDSKARQDCISLSFVPLSDKLASKVLEHLNERYTCGDGQLVRTLVEQQKRTEEKVVQTWMMPVIISSIIGSSILVLFASYVIRQQLKLNASLLKGHWKVSMDRIQPAYSKSLNLGRSSGPAIFSSGMTRQDKTSVGNNSYLSGVRRLRGMTVCWFEGHNVWLQATTYNSLDHLKVSTKRTLLWAQGLRHVNIGRLFGVTEAEYGMHFVMEFDTNGVLHDILQNEKYNLDDNFKFCLALDVASGMAFLHSEGVVHGNLTSSSCCIDSKWNVKVADWAFCKIAQQENDPSLLHPSYKVDDDILMDDDNIKARASFWQAPELVKKTIVWPTKECDVYSFAMLLVETFTRDYPYQGMALITEPRDIINEIVDNDLRPGSPPGSSVVLQSLLQQAWARDPSSRPSFVKVIKSLNNARSSKKGVLDCMMEAMKGYVEKLEEKVEERTAELAQATDSMRTLLHQILPPNVANKLQQGETVDPQSYDSVTIYFSDIVGFTSLSSVSTPMQIVQFLNCLYTCFDAVLDRHDVYKVETIGDAYMVISGLRESNGLSHAGHIATMALDLMQATITFDIPHMPDERLQLRAGMHSGPVAAGVVGVKMPQFCLFGDTVNTASRMESTSTAMKVQLSETSRDLLAQIGGYSMQKRGTVTVKVGRQGGRAGGRASMPASGKVL